MRGVFAGGPKRGRRRQRAREPSRDDAYMQGLFQCHIAAPAPCMHCIMPFVFLTPAAVLSVLHVRNTRWQPLCNWHHCDISQFHWLGAPAPRAQARERGNDRTTGAAAAWDGRAASCTAHFRAVQPKHAGLVYMCSPGFHGIPSLNKLGVKGAPVGWLRSPSQAHLTKSTNACSSRLARSWSSGRHPPCTHLCCACCCAHKQPTKHTFIGQHAASVRELSARPTYLTGPSGATATRRGGKAHYNRPEWGALSEWRRLWH